MKTKFSLLLILFLPILYFFSWFHEIGHALMVILTGNIVGSIEVNILGGVVYIVYRNYSMRWLISIMGSIFTLIISIPFMIYSVKKKNMYIFFMAFIQTTKEVLYWGISPFMKHGDAYHIIQWAEWFNLEIIIIIVYIFAILSLIMTVMLFVLFEVYNIKIINQELERKKPNYKNGFKQIKLELKIRGV